MNDLSNPLPPSSDLRESITRQMADLTRASASSQALLSRHPNLRERASELLVSVLKDIDLKQAIGVSSPDAIFFNQIFPGRIHSVAMSDLLVDAMRHGDSVVNIEGAGFFTRHDTIAAQFAVPEQLSLELKSAITRSAPILPSYYRARLIAPWTQLEENSADPSAKTQGQALSEVHRQALQCELALRGLSGSLSPEDQKRLADVVDSAAPDGVFNLLWVAADGTRVTVPSAYVVSQSEQQTQPSGVVFLVMPARGIQRFESIDLLREALSGPLANVVKDLMWISDQLRLQDQKSIGLDAWDFEQMNNPLIDAHAQAVESKQMRDCNFLLAQGNDDTDRSAFYARLERVHTCAHLDDGMGHRFITLTGELNEILQPHWRKYADEKYKATLRRLEQAHDENKKKVDDLFREVESLEGFADEQITQFMRANLGRFIDPGLIQITVQDSIELVADETLAVSHQKSLLEFAVQGLPDGAGSMAISPSPDQIHTDFSPRFIEGMLKTLDLHRRYEEIVHRITGDEENLRIMAHHRDSAIALGATAARMQGHLLQDRSLDLVHLMGGDTPKDGAVHSMGSLHLAATDSRFRDLIVFEEKTAADEHYVLYAPGAPNGRDFYEFSTWRQLNLEVGGWLGSESGRRYVGGQLAGPDEAMVASVLNNVQLKPSIWGPDSCVLVRSSGLNYESRLVGLVRQKALSALPARHFNPQAPDARPPGVTPSEQALVEARIGALNEEFVRLSPDLISLRDYVRHEASDILNEWLSSEGYPHHVDPDTLYLGLGGAYTDTPDFGELSSFTDLMMFGNAQVLSHRPNIHLYSSVGLDVRKLPVKLIQFMDRQIIEADLGARYMKFLVDRFLGRATPDFHRRRAVFAQRIHNEMIRGAMNECVNGRLTDAQYSWLRQTISAFSGVVSAPQSAPAMTVSSFSIDRQIVEGVYIFRDFTNDDPDYKLLFTPNAPDGRDFRPLTDYAQLMEAPSMQSYYLSRVSQYGQLRAGTYLDELYRGGKYKPDFVKIEYWSEHRVPSAEQLYGSMIERMIEDVDSLTESVAEKRFALAWTIIRWTGTILLLPFPHASFAWGVLTTTVTLIEAFNAYAAGDRAAALPLFVAGVFGIVTGGDAARALITGGQTVAKAIVTTAGLWAWRKLNLGSVYRVIA